MRLYERDKTSSISMYPPFFGHLLTQKATLTIDHENHEIKLKDDASNKR